MRNLVLRAFSALGAWYSARAGARSPWTNAYGAGRSAIALATLLTLVANPARNLFMEPGAGGFRGCDAISRVSLFCIVPRNDLPVAAWIACAVLLVVVAGWRPRATAIPHWWLTFSFYAGVGPVDGGDQMAAVLTLLLIPLALTDPRRWHWGARPAAGGQPFAAVATAWLAMLVCQLQVAIVYFDAFVEKLRVPEWANGTELYYVMHDAFFGAPSYLAGALHALAASSWIVPVTWSVLCLEFLLGINIVLAPSARRTLLVLALVFHAGIAVFLGITSFALVMCGALLIGLCPIGSTLRELFDGASRSRAGRAAPETSVLQSYASRKANYS